MNDGLQEAIERQIARSWGGPGTAETLARDLTRAVRAFLALPPSEEEIEAAAIALCVRHSSNHARACGNCTSLARSALIASRAVLVPPPEVEKGTS